MYKARRARGDITDQFREVWLSWVAKWRGLEFCKSGTISVSLLRGYYNSTADIRAPRVPLQWLNKYNTFSQATDEYKTRALIWTSDKVFCIIEESQVSPI